MTYQGYVNENRIYGTGMSRSNTRQPDYSRQRSEGRGSYNADKAEAVRLRTAQAEEMRRRRAAAEEMRRREEARIRRREADLRRARAYEARLKREQKEAIKARRAEAKRIREAEEAAILDREIKVEKKKLSVSFVATVLTAFVLLMGVVFSYAQLSGTGAELSEVNSKLASVEAEVAELEVALDHKNDITVIEDRAVNELRMVREDSVQKKYVSAVIGDRIILETDENEDSVSTGFASSVLSSFSSAFDDILDFFR